MTDIVATTLIMLVAAFWGGIGGVIYWAVPELPGTTTEFLKRFAGGLAAGAVTNVLVGIAPFDSAGAWDAAGVTKLIVAGFAGVSSLGTLLPLKFNEKVKTLTGDKNKLTEQRDRLTEERDSLRVERDGLKGRLDMLEGRRGPDAGGRLSA